MKKRILLILVAAILLWGTLTVSAAEEGTTAVRDWYIDLGDDISANFYLEIPEATAAQSVVKATVADQTKTYNVSELTPNTNGLYMISVDLAAAQLTEEISLQLVVDGTEYTPVSYSIRDYALQILTGNYSEEAKSLIKHMLDYGAAAQTHFAVNTGDMANAGYVLDYTAQYPEGYSEMTVDGQISGVVPYGASLVMEHKVAMRYYFLADSIEGITFTANDVKYTAVEKNDGVFYVEIPGIAPQSYAQTVALTAQKGEETLEVTYSPMTYLVRMSQKGQDSMKALANAMYGYYEAACAYIDSEAFSSANGSWDLSNQYNGSLTVLKQKDGTTVKTNADNYRGVSVKVKEYTPSLNEDGTLKKGNFSAQISFIFDNGKQYQVRIHNTDDGNYKLQNMGGDNSITGWKWQADLTTAQKEKLINGDGVEFGVKLVGPNAELWVDGTRMKVVELGAEYAGKTAQISVCLNGNTGVENMEVPFALVTPTAPVQLNVAELTGGTVTVDSGYQVGDTIPVTVKADAGYSQKLYINGQPLLLGGNTNSYSFVATEEVYNITGSFEPDVFSTVKGNWSLNDQQHGDLIITSQKDGTAVTTNAIGYRGVSIKVKDYTPSKNEDGSLKQGNFSMQVALIFQDGKYYEVRIHNTNADGNYKLQNVGGTNNLGGSNWPWLADLTTEQKANLLDGDGAEFTVKLVDSVVELWIDGTRMKVIELGDTYEGQLAQVRLCMNGNTGVQNLHIPYELLTETADVQLNIAEMTGGTVTAEYDSYHVGDTVSLTVAADEGYSQKLYINDQAVLLDADSNVYSFVASEEIYNITGSFEPGIFNISSGSWDLNNQHHGAVTILNKTADGTTVVTNESIYKEVAVTVKDFTPSKNEDGSLKQGGFAMQVSFVFDDGKQYQVRLHNTDADGNYKLQNMGGTNSITGWKWQADLTTAQKAKLLDGDGVEFAVKLVGPNAELWVDGTRMKVVELGEAYDGKLAQIKLCMNGNKNGQNIEMPFVLKTVEEAPNVQFNIPELANGTVAPEYDNYKVGDTVTLTVTPADGYSQKLYINGEPMLVNANGAYSFEATKEVYNITGSFEPSLSVSTNGRWYATNQAHGILNAYYPNNNDAWKMSVNGEYNSLAIMVKNFLPQADTMEGDALGGFSAVIGVKMDNGNIYSFRIINKKIDGAPQYQYSRFGGDGKAGWGGKCVLDDKVPGATDLINGDGIEFKVTRTGDNTLTLTLNGVVIDTYTMDGITADNKVSAVLVYHYGNRGENVEVPFTVQ